MKINRHLSELICEATTKTEVETWLKLVEGEIGGLHWKPVGGKENNVHTIEVSTNPGLALIERPTNSIDAMLDLAYLRTKENASSPSRAAEMWYDVPEGDLTKMSLKESRDLSEHIALRMMDSGVDARPTVQIQDTGTGQHPDFWHTTLLSLQESNKKKSMHLMGVYNSGGSASFRFSEYTVVISRRCPGLLDGLDDEIGVTIVRYNPMDPEIFKTGTYEYCTSAGGDILRLDIQDNELGFSTHVGGKMIHGTIFRHVQYNLDKYSGRADLPTGSLFHLLNAALPSPVLPIRFFEERERLLGGKKPQWRVCRGNLQRLNNPKVSEYAERRLVELEGLGQLMLYYNVISHDKIPGAYVSKDQAFTVIHNGQRQIAESRYWLRRRTGLSFLWKRLVVHVDASGLSNEAKREIFSSTREGGVDTETLRELKDKVIEEIIQDEVLQALEESDKQRALDNSTRSTSQKLKRKLAKEISVMLKGSIGGDIGGVDVPKSKGKTFGIPPRPDISDEDLLEIPDKLSIINGPLNIFPGTKKNLVLEINAKNGFLPKYETGLKVEFSNGFGGRVYAQSTGSLVGGKTRIVISCDPDAPLVVGDLVISLNIPELDLLLTDHTTVTVAEPPEDIPTKPRGGEPDVDIIWIDEPEWDTFEWTKLNVGSCVIRRGIDSTPIGVTFYLNAGFHSFSVARKSKKDLTEESVEKFNDSYAFPICTALVRAELQAEELISEFESKGRTLDIPSEYKVLENARMAHAVMMSIAPGIIIPEPDYSVLKSKSDELMGGIEMLHEPELVSWEKN